MSGFAMSRMHPLRKLLVLGLNGALARGLVTLDPTDGADGHTFVPIAGRNSVVMWLGIGWGELRLSVWWDYNHARHPQAADERFVTSQPLARRERLGDFVAATVSGWVERETGQHLQGKGRRGLFDTYVRRDAREALAALPEPVPAGFAVTGKFFL